MRPKGPDLERALVGHFDDHHARLCTKMLARIGDLTAAITELTEEIDTRIRPLDHARKRLSTIPGVSDHVAEVIIADCSGSFSGRTRKRDPVAARRRQPQHGPRAPTCPRDIGGWSADAPGHFLTGASALSSTTQSGEIGVDHPADHLLERDRGRPAELASRTGSVA